MSKKKKMPQKFQKWIDARKRFHLSHSQIQMARELGLNPDKFGKLATLIINKNHGNYLYRNI